MFLCLSNCELLEGTDWLLFGLALPAHARPGDSDKVQVKKLMLFSPEQLIPFDSVYLVLPFVNLKG